jgi:hypothetical protein
MGRSEQGAIVTITTEDLQLIDERVDAKLRAVLDAMLERAQLRHDAANDVHAACEVAQALYAGRRVLRTLAPPAEPEFNCPPRWELDRRVQGRLAEPVRAERHEFVCSVPGMDTRKCINHECRKPGCGKPYSHPIHTETSRSAEADDCHVRQPGMVGVFHPADQSLAHTETGERRAAKTVRRPGPESPISAEAGAETPEGWRPSNLIDAETGERIMLPDDGMTQQERARRIVGIERGAEPEPQRCVKGIQPQADCMSEPCSPAPPAALPPMPQDAIDAALDAIADEGCGCDGDSGITLLAEHTCLGGRAEYAIVSLRSWAEQVVRTLREENAELLAMLDADAFRATQAQREIERYRGESDRLLGKLQDEIRSHAQTDTLRVNAEAERDELAEWKRRAMEQKPIGTLASSGNKFGEIEWRPGCEWAALEMDTLLYALPVSHKEAVEKAVEAEREATQDLLASIRLYANDTLSGSATGESDAAWYREGVVWIRDRAALLGEIDKEPK